MTEMNSNHIPLRKSRWIIIGLVLCIFGLAFSAYSLSHHLEVKKYGQSDYTCNVSETFNCDDIANSTYSEVLGVPLGTWGLGYFLAMFVLLVLSFWKQFVRIGLQTYALLVVTGLLASIALFLISWFLVGSLCLSCIGIYTAIILHSFLVVANRLQILEDKNVKNLINGLTISFFVVAITLVAYLFLVSPTVKLPEGDTPSENPVNENDHNLDGDVKEIKIETSPYSANGEDYRKGSDDAAVVIVEFADFQCSACSRVASTLEKIHDIYKTDILVVFKNYPLDRKCNTAIKREMHKYACDTAVLARCAGQYGKFWEYHNLVFSRQVEVGGNNIRTWATEIGLTDVQINSCFASNDLFNKIKSDAEQGNALGVNATPTIFINGMKFTGRPSLENISREIDLLLSN